MSSIPHKKEVNKIDAVHQHLDTAIKLWFIEKNPTAVHSLAYAAFEIINAINKKKGGNNDLLCNSRTKEEIIWLKRYANFFKHADKDPYATIDFPKEISAGLIFLTIRGLDRLGEETNYVELAFIHWLEIHNSSFFNKSHQKFINSQNNINEIKKLAKCDFLQWFITQKIEKEISSFML